MSDKKISEFYSLYMDDQNYGVMELVDLLDLVKEHIQGADLDLEEPMQIVITKLNLTRKEFRALPEAEDPA